MESWTEVSDRRSKHRVRIAAGADLAGPTGVTASAAVVDRSGGGDSN